MAIFNTIEQRRSYLFEEVNNYINETADLRKEINEALHVEYDPITMEYIKEDSEAFYKDLKYGKLDLRKVFGKMNDNLIKIKNAIKVCYGMAKDLNDLMLQIKDIYEHNRIARFKHRNDKVKCELYVTMSIDKKDGKMYTSIYPDNIAYDPSFFIDKCNFLMNVIDGKIEDVNPDEIVENIIKNLEDSMENNHYQTKYFKPIVKVYTYNSVPFGKAVKSLLNNVKVFYNNIAYMGNIIDYQLLFIQHMDSAYKNFLNRISSNDPNKDKKKEVVDKIFGYTANNMNLAIEYDNVILEILTEVYKKTANELIEYKNILNS